MAQAKLVTESYFLGYEAILQTRELAQAENVAQTCARSNAASIDRAAGAPSLCNDQEKSNCIYASPYSIHR
jgi:hypothetical protein